MHSSEERIKSFGEVRWDSLEFSLKDEIIKSIRKEERDFILNIDEEEYKNSLYEEFSLMPLELGEEIIERPVPITGCPGKFTCIIKYQFEGTAILFKIIPNQYTLTSYKIFLNGRESTVSFAFTYEGTDPDKFRKTKENIYRMAFDNLRNINQNVETWNNNLINLIDREFTSLKQRYLEENKFFEAINVKVDEKTRSIFAVPTIKKKIIPPPTISKTKTYHSEPTVSMEMYDDILEVIYNVGKKMERKPSLYKNKEENDLRDLFLIFLETRYEGVTATGETFNREGKTDILLKYANDGSNLFVAECKVWNGINTLIEGISQLFDKYLTWRDSKTALIIFVKNKGFSQVLEKIKNETKNHDYCLKELGEKGESSFSYLFRFPQDEDKQVYLEVMAFHFDIE